MNQAQQDRMIAELQKMLGLQRNLRQQMGKEPWLMRKAYEVEEKIGRMIKEYGRPVYAATPTRVFLPN